MKISLEGRTAIITGGSLGLGLAMAEAFYGAGAWVALLARREGPLADARSRLLEMDAPPSAAVATFVCDVADGAQIQRAYGQVTDTLGDVDILINNAGKAAARPFESVTDEDWQADLDLKLFAAIRLSRLVWPHMKAQKWGRIINLLNIAAKAPGGNTAPTSVSRAAGMAFSKVLANEGAAHNILVNAMLIGFIKSDQIRRRYEASDNAESFADFVAAQGARLPMGRMGESDEAANLALFLASDAASYITGCAINMDGGLSPVV